jgi:hypothetical protein
MNTNSDINQGYVVNSGQQNFIGSQSHSGNGDNVGAGSSKNVTYNYANTNQHETVKEIQNLINQLSHNTPVNSTSEQMQIATQAIATIENNPNWKQKAMAAGKQGLLEVLKSNPIGAFVAGAIEGWQA